MLIINADDLGRSKAETDVALRCYEKGRITSTSAMMFMRDSERAAELALSSGIGVGLHINLSEKFSSKNIPAKLQDSHEQICRFLRSSKYSLILFHPLLADKFRYVFEAQATEFQRLFGREPSHYDGHQHMHVASNMLLQQILPVGAKVRRSFSFRSGEKGFLNRWYRSAVDNKLIQRHHVTDYFYALGHYLTLDRFEDILSLTKETYVELMAHPILEKEYNFLMSEEVGEALSRVRLTSYLELQ